ncbi:MAG: hypothetical protein DWI24_05655 [Planctomycetota bacterium]|nr:MAG: hypothetical protein DWI24_05655 [Planctomycetota bacterium]
MATKPDSKPLKMPDHVTRQSRFQIMQFAQALYFAQSSACLPACLPSIEFTPKIRQIQTIR